MITRLTIILDMLGFFNAVVLYILCRRNLEYRYEYAAVIGLSYSRHLGKIGRVKVLSAIVSFNIFNRLMDKGIFPRK